MTGFEISLLCLALNVYKEARGEPVDAQHAVALVTLNRTKRRGLNGDVCLTVMEPYQFSWTINDIKDGVLLPGKAPKRTSPSWHRAYQSAKEAMYMPDFTAGATHFHTPQVNPAWAQKLRYIGQWGNHYFYREDEDDKRQGISQKTRLTATVKGLEVSEQWEAEGRVALVREAAAVCADV